MPKQKYSVKITGMTCTACAQTIEKALSKAQGVDRVRVIFSQKKLLGINPSIYTHASSLLRKNEGNLIRYLKDYPQVYQYATPVLQINYSVIVSYMESMMYHGKIPYRIRGTSKTLYKAFATHHQKFATDPLYERFMNNLFNMIHRDYQKKPALVLRLLRIEPRLLDSHILVDGKRVYHLEKLRKNPGFLRRLGDMNIGSPLKCKWDEPRSDAHVAYCTQ